MVLIYDKLLSINKGKYVNTKEKGQNCGQCWEVILEM